VTLVAITMSFANGIGSGIIMTLGVDVAPANSRARFLSIWRVMSDSGNAARYSPHATRAMVRARQQACEAR
jgi:hypothetical protein